MVKTRHSAGIDEGFQPLLLPLTKRSRRKHREEHENFDSDNESGIVRIRSRKPIRNISSPEGTPSVCTYSMKTKRQQVLIEDTTEEDDTPPKPPSKKRHVESNKNASVMNGDYGSIRRSTRQRKLVYGTYDQKILQKVASTYLDYEASQEENDGNETNADDNEVHEDKFTDMYSRVKTARRRVNREMYSISVPEEDTDASHISGGDVTDDLEAEGRELEDEEEQQPPQRSYFLREHKPRTQLFEAPPIEPIQKRTRTQSLYCDASSPRSSGHRDNHKTYRSPAHRSNKFRRTAFHGSSSTSSSGDSSSDDERRFERRKSKSMARARNRCLPMNFTAKDIAVGCIRDRVRIGSSLADVNPMTIDKSVTFESIGGLGKHLRALKEMIVFPLLYPEVFDRFKISPPRGVLFYGPPGTGKTLVARALANECSKDDRRVAFFMRKGADCLSKWVGESERQLRLLFDQAYQMRPSIIFFDEIDGLAPVRSSRQDQIHSSIVSTLLALMDGLDSRGEIVIIGATNRIDAIDPALRRPGRFDREFIFPLPSLEARKQILKIHTKDWNPKLSNAFISEVAEKCVGYCGADLKALCTEAALLALRRRYPQIYTSSEKLQLDVSSIQMGARDFHKAMQVIVPTAQRSLTSPAHALVPLVRPLLLSTLKNVLEMLQKIYLCGFVQSASVDSEGIWKKSDGTDGSQDFDLFLTDDDDDDNGPCIFDQSRYRGKKHNHGAQPDEHFLKHMSSAFKQPTTHRPRLLLAGSVGQGQTTHIAPAVLHHLEVFPVHALDLPTLFGVSAKTPEEACAQVFREARRTCPSIIYMPHLNQWWGVLGETLRATFLTMVNDLDPSAPILLLATSEQTLEFLDEPIQKLFDAMSKEVIHMENPSREERQEFFRDILLNQATHPPVQKKQAAQRVLEELPKAPPPSPRKLTDAEIKKLRAQEESTLRELRVFLRNIWNKLTRCRKFSIFMKPVDVEDVPDYYDIVKEPMDLSTMLVKIDNQMYQTAKEFLNDIYLIWKNALEYNPDKDPTGKIIRHRVCALKDMAHAIMESELDPEFEKICVEIMESRIRRGEVPRPAPMFTYPVLQRSQQQKQQQPQEVQKQEQQTVKENLPLDYPTRFSRRVRGMEAEALPNVTLVEKILQGESHESKQKLTEKNQVKQSENEMKGKQEPTTVSMPTHWRQKNRKRRSRSASTKLMDNGHSGDDEVSGTDDDDDSHVKTRHKSEPANTALTTSFENSSTSPVHHPSFKATHNSIQGYSFESNGQGPRTSRLLTAVPTSHVDSASRSGLDSGIGSAIESNGESLDSLDHSKVSSQVSKIDYEQTSKLRDSGADIQQTEGDLTTFQVMQQSRTQNKQKHENIDKVDKESMSKLLDQVVAMTDNFTVEKLEKLHSMVSCCIYQHRLECDKTKLLKDLTSRLLQFTSGHNKAV